VSDHDFFDSFPKESEAMLKAVGAIAVGAFLIFLSPLVGILAGAFVGWVVSIMAPVWVPTGLGYLGIHVAETQLVALGAALGFLGGFFRITKPAE
jgi:hypothetical protein